MRSWLAAATGVIVLLAVILTAPKGFAARDGAPVVTGSISTVELLVFESERCIYCQLFRRDVRPIYERSNRAQTVPLRFVDIGEVDSKRLPIARPIETLPTVVLVKDGREVDRIAGYTGPESFIHLVNRMIGSIE